MTWYAHAEGKPQTAHDSEEAAQPAASERKIERRGWFADWDVESSTDYGWQPCLETGLGHIPCFQVWFKTKAECEEWIAANVIGSGWFPGDPTEIETSPAAAAPAQREGRTT